MAAVIEARGLVKTFKGGQRAVDGLDLSVNEGEIYGFLGPNGAGKTTTIKMLLGLTHPTSGTTRIDGRDVWREPREAKARLGFLPETLSFYKTLTGRETLKFFADLRGVRREEVDERLAQVGLEEAGGKRVGAYSKGMVQRLGLAQALIGDPAILVLDEPSSGLDPMGARQVRDLIRGAHARGATVFFSSHILSEVQEVAERVAIIRRGRLVAQDSVAALRERLALPGIIALTLAAPPSAELIDVVRAVDGVGEVAARGNTLEVHSDPAVRWKIGQAAESAGATILNVETRDASLEDVFVKLTGEDDTPVGVTH